MAAKSKKAAQLDDFINFNWLHSMRGAEFRNLKKLRDDHNASKDHSYLENKKGCDLCDQIKKAEKIWRAEQERKMEETNCAD